MNPAGVRAYGLEHATIKVKVKVKVKGAYSSLQACLFIAATGTHIPYGITPATRQR